ncbi:hypothetical protein WN944_029245 [Citrus x changshan-huyou]|uniref:Uncharacterized protein n=1 Tax=Citrus x changshan-huyou TaxID=2935761 RepID=A0AAP0LLE0_9ROSI
MSSFSPASRRCFTTTISLSLKSIPFLNDRLEFSSHAFHARYSPSSLTSLARTRYRRSCRYVVVQKINLECPLGLLGQILIKFVMFGAIKIYECSSDIADQVVLLKTKKRYSGRQEQEDDLVGLVSTSLCMLVCLGGYDENLELS